jgi:hypothetical protein
LAKYKERCLVCNEFVPKKLKVIHLHLHRLGVEDIGILFDYRLDKGRRNIPTISSNICPSCEHTFSPLIYKVYENPHRLISSSKLVKEVLQFLVKCPKCKKIYKIKKKIIISNRNL